MRNLFGGLRRRNRTEANVSPADTSSADAELIELQVVTASEAFTLQVPPSGTRVTDLLNSNDQIRGRRVGHHGEATWASLPRSECLLVVPPQAIRDPKRRLHRPKQRLLIKFGSMRVSGAAHVPAGTEATAFLRRHGQPFVPLTKVTIEAPGEPRATVPVAIVHLALADSFEPAAGGA